MRTNYYYYHLPLSIATDVYRQRRLRLLPTISYYYLLQLTTTSNLLLATYYVLRTTFYDYGPAGSWGIMLGLLLCFC